VQADQTTLAVHLPIFINLSENFLIAKEAISLWQKINSEQSQRGLSLLS
jgi:hypothetical protein